MRQNRIPPGTPADVGRVNFALARLLGWVAGGGPPHIFTTLARHRRLFRRWLRFAGGLMPGGTLPRRDTELIILRVADNCRCDYEWHHHERLAPTTGLTAADVERVREGPEAEGWSERQRLLLRAADELHGADRVLSDATWDGLRPQLSDAQLIELCLLIGHYEMLAMTLNSLGVQPDRLRGEGPPKPVRALQSLVERKRAKAAA